MCAGYAATPASAGGTSSSLLVVRLPGEYVGLEQTDDGVYDVYFCDLYIGKLLEEKKRIADILKRLPLGKIYNRKEV